MQPKNTTLKTTFWFVLTLIAVCALSVTARAQLVQPVDSNLVQDISIEFEGTRSISDEAVLAHVKIKEGMPYDQTLVDQSIRALYSTGFYQFIQVKREPMTGGGSRLVFQILPKYRISGIFYEGNSKVSTSKLKELSKLEEGQSLDDVKTKFAADEMRKHYREKGYADAVVDYAIQRDPELGSGTITFRISEGARLGISEITFTGNHSIKSGDLRDEMRTKERNWISWITGTGRYKEREFEDDLQLLREYYKDQGFLDVEIPQAEVTFSYPTSSKMVINIQVYEGRRYYIGDISIEGNTLYPTDELFAQLTMQKGDIFSPTAVDKNAEVLKDYYGTVGYLDTVVRAERIPNLDTGNIDLKMSIRESEKFYVESINIQGNTKTKSIVLLRELALAPGDVFDLVRMKNSEARLRNTGFFEEVNLAPEETGIPGRRNLRINVKEGRTGNLTFGAGFSSVESAVVFAELTQGNFDLFNYRSMFQGDGQKFRMRLSLGSKSNQALIAFEEPWLFERELAFGFELFRSESSYNSSIYDELRTGFETYFRKRLFELVEGRLSYRLENVDINNVDATASNAIKSEAGSTLVSKLGFSLLRDTRDSLVIPTEGSRYQFISELAGLGGDADYIRLEGRAARWWPTFKTQKQVFSLVGRTGSVIPYGSSRVPFFDRYFLGGPNTLRGFKFRDVGPKDVNNEAIGGNSFGFWSAEYSLEVVDPVRFAVFYDGGFVNANDGDFSLSDYNDDIGFGVRILIMGAPLRIDFGFPLTSDATNDDGMQFNFSFGTVF